MPPHAFHCAINSGLEKGVEMSHGNLTKEVLQNYVLSAVRMVYEKNNILIKNGANERCVVAHIFACLLGIMGREIGDLSLDFEYNRQGYSSESKDMGEKKRRIVPDLVLHRRCTNDDNILVVEVKKNRTTRSRRKHDINKLEKMTLDPYNYQFGLYLELESEQVVLTWFENGRQLDKEPIKKPMINNIMRGI